MDLVETTLEPLLADIVGRFAPLAAERSVRIQAELDPRVRARVDADALRQMVTNLLDNALKYGPMGQTVRVTLEVDGREARITVADQGPGIAARDREVVWRRFVRLPGSRGPQPGAAPTTGTGIGLSVVRDLAIAHGGRAWVDGAASGGATFVVALPAVAKP
jgi:signal transduction histidine kinase